jgi:hypothetical protein
MRGDFNNFTGDAMKKYGMLLASAFLMFCVNVHAGWFGNSLKTGTYELKGSNGDYSYSQYQGTVIIKPQGSNYHLTWIINGKQLQMGIGILENEVLSVAYYDASNPNGTGVVAYRLTSDNTLEGKWAGVNSSGFGREYLNWMGY